MSVEFNHTIVWSRDSKASATFLAGMLGLPAPKKWGPFQVVTTANGVNVDFMDEEGEIGSQHYAFLERRGVRPDLRCRERARHHPLGRSGADKGGGDQPSRRRTQRLFRGPERPSAGNHYPPIWQQRVEALRQARGSVAQLPEVCSEEIPICVDSG